MPKYLIDTNIYIYFHKNVSDAVNARFDKLLLGEAALSVITWGELLTGAHKSPRPARTFQQLDMMREFLPVLAMTEAVSEEYGQIRARLQSEGRIIGGNDLWIAAHAMAAELTLVTNNEREFARIDGLKIENWTRA